MVRVMWSRCLSDLSRALPPSPSAEDLSRLAVFTVTAYTTKPLMEIRVYVVNVAFLHGVSRSGVFVCVLKTYNVFFVGFVCVTNL